MELSQSPADKQREELQVLRSIFPAEDFLPLPPKYNAWNGPPEFMLKVRHPEPTCAEEVCFNLHVVFTQTYPINPPALRIHKPAFGLNERNVDTLQGLINLKVKECLGNAMIYDIYDFCLDWLRDNIIPGTPGISLASEMSHRAAQEEEASDANLQRQEEEKQREQLSAQLNLDSLRKKETMRVERQRARRRGLSNPDEAVQTVEVPIEVFKEKIEVRYNEQRIEFDSVMTFNPRTEHLGITWKAEPVCDAPRGSLTFDLHVVSFDSNHYGTVKGTLFGMKKLEEIEKELRVLSTIRHPNLVNLYAVKLSFGQFPRISILTEQRPGMLVYDLLRSTSSLSQQKATEFLQQCLSALNALHNRGLFHRGMRIHATCIGLSGGRDLRGTPIIKLERACWYTILRDLHKSNPFGQLRPHLEDVIPETWLPREVVHSPLSYTPSRDISQLGISFVQMLLGLDVLARYSDPFTAVNSHEFPETLRDLTVAMLEAGKKRSTTCLSLLANLPVDSGLGTPLNIAMTSPSILTPPGRFWPPKSPERERSLYSSYRPHHSRWREDWEELEHLGEGGFGRVVKARNRLDGRIYAVKKIKLLQNTQDDEKIFREVKLLSRLQHRHIVRYYTTWLETPDETASESSSNSDHSSDTGSEETSRQPSVDDDFFAIDLDDMTTRSVSQSTSFPSIHFSRESSERLSSMDDPDSGSEDGSGSLSPSLSRYPEKESFTPAHRVLYIQMEFVERQTLIERITEGLSEEEAWRLFHQLLEALVHMSSLQILHRDSESIVFFIDKNGDIKVGDFGLATSNLTATLSSEPSPGTRTSTIHGEMTLDIGTRLYTAPEVLGSGSRRYHDHTKADIYSLGIVFFEMNFSFSTQSERIAVLEDLRRPEIIFPNAWQGRLRQRQIIISMLQHDVVVRPTAQQLFKSDLLPPRVQDEFFRNALQVMTQRGSAHYGEILNSFFDQSPQSTALSYDRDVKVPAYASLLPIVQDYLAEIFRLHGAVDSPLPLLLPKVDREDYGSNTVFLLDRQGELVSLPRNGLIPMARRAAQSNIRRIKRYHIGDVYSASLGGGHPNVRKAAVVDVITPDLTMGAQPAVAELLGIADQCLNAFPGPEFSDYVVHITHTDVKECVYNRIPAARRSTVQDVLSQPKSSWRTKRGLLVKGNVPKGTLDELEALSEADDLELLMANVSRVSTSLHSTLTPLVDDIRQVIRYAKTIGVSRTIKFRPLMDSKNFVEPGVWFQIVKPSKRAELIAGGGRYDHLMKKFADPTVKAEAVRAFGLQIDVERIAMHLAAHQSISVGNLIREKRSFGAFSPRRCDVYIYSFQGGYLAERLEVAALLWKNNISADLMYDVALNSEEDHMKICADEGILFTVYPKPTTARPDQPAFKVKSVLRETETGVSRYDLVPFLLAQIAEQRKIDVPASMSTLTGVTTQTLNKEITTGDNVQLILLQDSNRKLKKPPKGVKDAMNPAKEKASDLAYGLSQSLRQSFQQGLPIVAVDIPTLAFNAMTNDAYAGWLTHEDAWKAVLVAMPQIPSARAGAIRDAILRKKEEGKKHVLLFHIHDERTFLFTLHS
ncbi:Serine/threonine-protein kinase [Ramaria rubella]|nr:Serine/threonine-protein kinase [Ramaria rubella]